MTFMRFITLAFLVMFFQTGEFEEESLVELKVRRPDGVNYPVAILITDGLQYSEVILPQKGDLQFDTVLLCNTPYSIQISCNGMKNSIVRYYNDNCVDTTLFIDIVRHGDEY